MVASNGETKGYYFRYSKHLNLADISEKKLSDRSGVSRNTLNKIRSARSPVSAESIRKVINAINDSMYEQGRSKTVTWNFDEEYSSERQLELDMSGTTTTQRIEGVTPVEFAILSLTNPKDWANSTDEQPFRILTSNEIYYYVPFIASMLEYDGEEAEEVFGDQMESFLSTTRRVFEDRFKTDGLMLPSSQQIGKVEPELLRLLGLDDEPEKIIEVNGTLKSLCERGLIVDPLVETVGLVGVSVLGIVPTSFTKRTEDGDIVYRKISALLWEYEYLTEDEKVETKLYFNAQKIIDLFKSLVFSLNKNLNGEGEN